ncbi:MAG TPA: response regulator transcription factor [Vicinamibacterales bacterium]|nr:response regulator transcription factor [Vicinamibacterales bacterium]
MDDRARAILMVDDDEGLCELVQEFLGREGYDVTAVHDGASGLGAALAGRFVLVILDVMLPVLDGFALLRQLRRQSNVPVIMLTARAGEQDRVGGLGEGADDYLVKPFAAAELLARIRAVLRRALHRSDLVSSVVQVGDLRVSALNRAVSYRGVPIELTPTEFTILEVLMRAVGRIVSRNELASVLYQRESTPYERSLDVHVSHLRRKLEAVGWTAIRTVRGQGYICVTDA